MANSGILSTQWSGTYPTAAWVFRWTSTYVSPGKSKISWTLRTEGRNSTPKMLWSHCTLYINGIEKAKFEEDGWYYDGRDRANGEFECEHNSSGGASFIVKMIGRTYEGGESTNKTTETTFYLDTNYPYTSCSNPTTVTISPSIQKPADKFTISWNGASEGTANPIIGYLVQYKVGNDTNWQDANGGKVINGSSFSISTPDRRGETIIARVKTVGRAGSAYSPTDYKGITNGSSCKINKVPPQIGSVTLQSTPASNDEWCTINLTTSTMTDDDNTALKYQYKSGNDWLDFVPPFGGYIKNLSPGESITYNFRLSDGLEGSAPTSCVVTKNIKPSSTMAVDYTKDVAEQEITLESTKTGDSIRFDYACEYNGKQYELISRSETNQYNISDIRSFLFTKLREDNGEFSYSSNKSYTYTLKGRVYDGIEYGDWNSEERSFTTPELSLSTPELSLPTVSENNSGYFEDYVNVALGFDDNNDRGGNYTISGLTENNQINLNSIGRGEVVKSISFDEGFSIKPTNNIYRVKQISLKNNFETSPRIIKPRSATNIEFICSSNAQNYSEYGLGQNQIPKVYLMNGENSIELTPSESSSDNTWKFSISGPKFWGLFYSNSETYNNGETSFHFNIENDFGGKFEEYFNLNINFDEQAVLLNNSITLSPGLDLPDFENWNFLKEGMPIYYNFVLYAYDVPQVRLEIEGQDGWSEKFEPATLTILKSENEEISLEKLKEKLGKHYNTIPTKYTFNSKIQVHLEIEGRDNWVDYLIPEIHKDNTIAFKLFAKTNGNELKISPDKYSNLRVKAHYRPTAYFNEAKFFPELNGQNNVLQSKITIGDSGYFYNSGQTNIVGIKIYNGDDFTSSPNKEDSTYLWSGFINNNPQSWEFLRIAPMINSTLKATYSNGNGEGEGESFEITKSNEDFSYFVVYNIIPTMAYRKNSVAINTGELDNYTDGAFVVKTHTGKNMVYFLSTKYETPEYNIHTINLDEGSMHNFIFDCGSWTELPGGMTQSIGIGVSRAFADIAHSGEVGDLQQEREEDVIVIIGGGAPA